MDRRQIGCLIGIVMLIAWVPVTLAETVSEEAQRYMARGMAAVEMAKSASDYALATKEFEQAAKIAPNWPDVYFNLGSVQVKAENYGEAMRHYKRYLELAPNAPDAAKVREEIYKLEYRAEEKETELAFLEGDWTCVYQAQYKYKKHFTVRGHQVEVTTSNLFSKPSATLSNKTTNVYVAEIIENILVLSVISSSVPGYVGQIEKYKLLSNTVMSNTDWQCHKDKNNPLPDSASAASRIAAA